MSTDELPKVIVTRQYQGSANLEARIRLHEQFRLNQYGWHRWLFDQFSLPPAAHILELGCGMGKLWQENAYRIPATWYICLTDFSAGMLDKAQQNTAAIDPVRRYAVVNILDIPYADCQFDAVIANHMLYYLSAEADMAQALSHIRRVLKPGGRFYASTNGVNHMRAMVELVHEFDPALPFVTQVVSNFSLENGAGQAARWFNEVQVRRYEDELRVTDVNALIEFILSASTVFELEAERKLALSDYVRRRFADMGGKMIIGKDAGLISARRV